MLTWHIVIMQLLVVRKVDALANTFDFLVTSGVILAAHPPFTSARQVTSQEVTVYARRCMLNEHATTRPDSLRNAGQPSAGG